MNEIIKVFGYDKNKNLFTYFDKEFEEKDLKSSGLIDIIRKSSKIFNKFSIEFILDEAYYIINMEYKDMVKIKIRFRNRNHDFNDETFIGIIQKMAFEKNDTDIEYYYKIINEDKYDNNIFQRFLNNFYTYLLMLRNFKHSEKFDSIEEPELI